MIRSRDLDELHQIDELLRHFEEVWKFEPATAATEKKNAKREIVKLFFMQQVILDFF